MKAFVLALGAIGGAALSGSVLAAAPSPVFGTVVSATPVTVQVSVPRQQCVDEPGYVRAAPSGGGAVVGGILGGLAGNAIGAGAGRALATGAGVIAGAIAGNSVEAANAPAVPVTTTNCVYSRSVESRVVGYDVVYEFNGQRYTTRTVRDPGARIALDVRPSDESRSDYPPIASIVPAPTPYPVAAYPVPDPYPVPAYPYPPFGYGSAYYGYPAVPFYIEGGFGGGGGRGHRGR